MSVEIDVRWYLLHEPRACLRGNRNYILSTSHAMSHVFLSLPHAVRTSIQSREW